MFMRKIGIAAALMLCAFGASESNFRGADQVYVPVAGHAGGSSGLFISDAYLANLTGDIVDVAVIYVPRGTNAGGSAPAGLEEIRNRITLQPFERKRSEEHTSELQSPCNLVCRLLLETKKLVAFDSSRIIRR